MNKRPFCTVIPCGRPADFQIGLGFLCAEHALRLDYIDNNGTMLDPRLVNLRLADATKEVWDALANLVELHDEQPSQLTAEDWERARKALKK